MVARKQNGGSQSRLVLCDDRKLYVLKMHPNPQGPNVLANEAIGAILLSGLGFTVAPWRPIAINLKTLPSFPELIMETPHGTTLPACGVHFGCEYLGGPEYDLFDFIPGPYRIRNGEQVAAIRLFDLWANHRDHRQCVYCRPKRTEDYEAVFIATVTGGTEHVYHDVNYAAGSWAEERRVIIKAEVVCGQGKEPKDNPRFVITSMKQSPQWLYEKVYCQRGDIENRIKELHDLHIDRTSCSRFWANQFRVLLTAAAYVPMQELRLRAAGTHCARAQVWTLRERLLKLGARVVVSARRLVLHLRASFPFLDDFRKVAMTLGACTP
jgi:hypothetical protein